MMSDSAHEIRRTRRRSTREVALRLARADPRGVLPELTRMLNGEPRAWWRRYGLDEQILAIEALGETGSPEALALLERIGVSEISSSSREIVMHGQGSGDCNPYNVSLSCEQVAFPNANGALRTALGYSIDLEEKGCGEWTDRRREEDVENDRQRALAAPPHRALAEAIAKLKRPYKEAAP